MIDASLFSINTFDKYALANEKQARFDLDSLRWLHQNSILASSD